MEFGVTVPNLGGIASTETLAQMAVRIEELGFDAVFVSDHVVMPTTVTSRYPYGSSGVIGVGADEDVFEPFTVLAYLAGMTSRVRLGVSVMVLPYRHPVLNAKMLATLDVLSGGRLIAGVGVGWMKEEFEALDADYEHRGAVTDEHIQVLTALWTQEEPYFAGRHYRIEGVRSLPRPLQRPRPPIWVGGNTRPALRRAALLGDGWHAVRMTPAQLAGQCETLRRLREEHGVASQGFRVSVRSSLRVTDAPLTEGRTPLSGTPDQLLADVRAYRDAGADYMVVGASGSSLEETMGHLERFASDVLPAARGV